MNKLHPRKLANKSITRKDIDAVLEFLKEVGIEYLIHENVNGFLSNEIEIRNGIICFDYNNVQISDLLHESGHLALVAKGFRHLFSGNLNNGYRAYLTAINQLSFNEQLNTILMCCEDTQVTAWAWAAGVKLGLPHEDIINDEDYEGEGSEIRKCLELSENSPMPYIGVSMLHHANYTKKYNRLFQIREPETEFYPKMRFWTADQVLSAHGYSFP